MSASRLDQLLQMQKEDPDDSFTRYAIGLEYMGRREFLEALTWLEDLYKHDPDYLPTYYQLGSVYEELGRDDDAATTYTNGLAVGRKQNDLHTISELQAALDGL